MFHGTHSYMTQYSQQLQQCFFASLYLYIYLSILLLIQSVSFNFLEQDVKKMFYISRALLILQCCCYIIKCQMVLFVHLGSY